MNFLSDLGGIFNSVFVIGKLLVSLFIDSIFFSSIMKEHFQVHNILKMNKTRKLSKKGKLNTNISS